MDFINGKNFRIFLLGILDIICVAASSICSLALRFDISSIPPEYYEGAVRSMPVYFVVTIGAMAFFKLYNRVWTYASLNELFSIIKASVLIEAVFVCYHMFWQVSMPRSYYLINFGIMTILFCGVRFGKVFIKSFRNSQNRAKITNRIMVIGAGSAATILIKELRSSGEGSEVVCAIDDNKNKKNKYILGVPIVGGREDIEKNIKKYDITEIIIAIPSADIQTTREIIRICQETKKPVKILPAVSKSLTTSLSKEVRPVNYEDLLGRDPIKVNQEGINSFIKDKTVMVTGGGGSIGSELCRQIIKYNPKKLLILDIYENNAYEIQMEL